MAPPAHPSELPYVPRRWERLAWWAAALAAAGVASFWLVGQWLAWPLLMRDSYLGGMAASACLAIVLLVAAGGLLQWKERSKVARAVVWAILGGVTLMTLGLGLRNLIDPRSAWDPEVWLSSRAALAAVVPNRRLSVLAALALLLTVIGLVIQAGGWDARGVWRRWGLGLALGVGGLCGFAACSRLADIPVVSSGALSVSFWTALSLALLSLAQALSFRLVPEVFGIFADDSGVPAEPVSARLSARPQFWLLLGLGAAGLGAIALFVFLRVQVTWQRTLISGYVGKVAQLQVDQLVAWRQERMGDARVLMKAQFLADFIRENARGEGQTLGGSAFATYLDEYRRVYGYHAIVILNSALEPVLAVPGGAEKRVALPASLRQEVREARDVLVLDPPAGPAGESWMDLVAPLRRGEDGPAVGAVLLRIDADRQLQLTASRWPMLSSTAESVVARREGNVVTFLGRTKLRPLVRPGSRRVPENWDALAALVVRNAGESELIDVRDYRNVPVLALARNVPDSPWVLLLKLDKAEAYAPMRSEAWQLGTSFIVIVTALGLAGGAHWRKRQREYEQRHWRAETLQQEAMDRLTKIAGRVPGVVFQLRQYPDGRTCFPFASEAIREIFRVSPNEVQGDAARIFRLVHPEDLEAVNASILESARTLSLWNQEFRVKFDDGTVRWLQSSAAPQREPDGAVLWHGFTADITARKHAEALLRESLREKEALLKEVHHRVKNNLQVVSSLLRMESRRSGRGAESTVLNEMIGRVHSMALLHESLYRTGTFAAVELGAYIKRIATATLRAAAVPPGSVRLKLELERIEVEMDRALPCGLLVNELVSNAFKHGFPPGRTGEVTVRLERLAEGGQARLRVADTGVGLPPNFEQAPTDTLGLTLVRDLAVQLDGRLEIGPGPGAVFEVVFRVGLELPRSGSAASPGS